MTQPLQQIRPMPSIPLHDPEHRVGCGLDDEKRPHRLVDLHHLPGQAGSQVAHVAVHDPQQRGDVVGELRAGSPSGIVDVREVVFQVDSGADGEDGLEDSGQYRVLGIVLGGVVGGEERTTVQEQAAGPFATADERDGIRGVPHSGRTCARSSARPSTCCLAP